MDPYSILGVSRNASDEEIKRAYWKLSRKYHPDANINNPDKEEAEEKFKQIHEAYTQIMEERKSGAGYETHKNNDFGGFSGNKYQDEESLRRQAAANYIQSSHYREAMNVLRSLSQHNGQWYYLSAMSNMGLGNNVNALNDIREAVRLEPNNEQYRMMQQKMEEGGSWYQEMQQPYGDMPDIGSNFCMRLFVADLICGFFRHGRFFC